MNWGNRWMRPCVATGLAVLLPGSTFAQAPQPHRAAQPQPLAMPAPMDGESARLWGRGLIDQLCAVWSEGSEAARLKKLQIVVDDAPGSAAHFIRLFKRPEPATRLAATSALKDILTTMRRVEWRPSDGELLRKLTASWSVLIPDLVSALGDPAVSSDARRSVERVLVELALVTHEFAPAQTKEIWVGQVTPLANLTRHAKTTVRLGALNILETLGKHAAEAAPAVTQSLRDSDRFVRWSAVRALRSLGTTPESLRALAALQQDSDADVKEAAVAALLAVPPATESTSRAPETLAASSRSEPVTDSSTKAASLETVAKPEPTEGKALTMEQKVEQLAAQAEASLQRPPVAVSPKVPAITMEKKAEPEKSTEISLDVSASVPAKTAVESVKPAVEEIKPPEKTAALPSAPPQLMPVAPSAAPVLPPPPPPSPVPVAPHPQPAASTVMKPAPGATAIEPAAIQMPPTIPAKRVSEPAQPIIVIKSEEKKSTPPVPQPAVSSQVGHVANAISKLRSTHVGDQMEAIRSLGRLGPRAADAVPYLAEALVKGETLVRREVPLVMIQIGAPAKLALSVLERALEDQDTEVKVNAAKALLELSER